MSEAKTGDSKKISIKGIEDALRDAEQSVERIRTDSDREIPTMTEEQAAARLAESAASADDEELIVDDSATGEIFEVNEEPEEPEEPEAVAEPTEQLKEVEARLLRMAADFDNYKKRVARESKALQARAAESVIKALLPVMDNLERALQHTEADEASMVEGVQMVRQQLAEVFESHGVQAFADQGQTFDPAVHEAMAQQESEEQPRGAILEVYQRGYLLNEQLIRPALVIVSGGSPGQQAESEPSSDDEADGESAD